MAGAARRFSALLSVAVVLCFFMTGIARSQEGEYPVFFQVVPVIASTSVDEDGAPSRWRVGYHLGGALAVDYSSNGSWIASCGYDHRVAVWDSATDTLLQSLTTPYAAMTTVFSADSSLLASAWVDYSIRLWDTSNWEAFDPAYSLPTINDLAFSPDGTRLAAAGTDNNVWVWPVNDGSLGTEVAIGNAANRHTDRVWAVAYSPDGNVLASASVDTTIKLWDMSNGAAQATLIDTLRLHTGEVMDVAYFPDGVLASTAIDRTVRLWNGTTGAPLAVGTVPADHSYLGFESLAVSPDGSWLATGCDDTGPIVWWTRSGNSVAYHGLCYANGDDTVSLSFSPDSTELASASATGWIKLIPTGRIWVP